MNWRFRSVYALIFFQRTLKHFYISFVYWPLARASPRRQMPRSPCWWSIGLRVNAVSPKMRCSLNSTSWHWPPKWHIQDYSDDDVRWIGSIKALMEFLFRVLILDCRCSRQDDCKLAEETRRWLSYNVVQCVEISAITPFRSLPITEPQREVSL